MASAGWVYLSPGFLMNANRTSQTLRVFMGETDKWHEAPLYDAIVKKFSFLATDLLPGASI